MAILKTFSRRLLLTIGLAALTVHSATGVETERQYLSGRDAKDTVPWEFQCTGGRRAGEWTTIPVPSNWELQGFGGYDYGESNPKKFNEHGLYRLRFAVPETWKGRRIRLVFDGVMTDATVKVNGELAGPTHHGAFYRFRYDITSLVKLGAESANVLEVDVAKVSANAATERAERTGDYWVFGGIFRPVWLEAAPIQSLEHVAIDARADGALNAVITLGSVRDADRVEAQVLDAAGKPFGAPFSVNIPGGGTGRVRLKTRLESPRLWTAETPHLYSLKLALRKGEETLHTRTERFGFRTFEVRLGQGLFLNGERILLKGVNRHSFRPETGRALSLQDCADDVRLIKAMNMNAVRMSHYPPDKAFLEICDEQGLYVINELSGWHRAHDTETGRRLVREMIERDVNHPSILFWDNANEGGWNRELDGDFELYDPQHRTVLHPWELFNGMDTKHYPNYDDLVKRLAGPHILMPTEFIHALYDGGAAAGLEDYWKAIVASPVGAGGFIWVFADEGIVRTDQNNRIDVYSTFAPDGLVGPHHEKEGSFFTVRDLWSPVQIDAPVLDEKFDGTLTVRNSYDFTSLAQCRFTWRLVRFDPAAPKGQALPARAATLAEGSVESPAISPDASGQLALKLTSTWRDADALALTALNPAGEPLWTWTWPTRTFATRTAAATAPQAGSTAKPKIEKTDNEIRLTANDVTASFDARSGVLQSVRRGGKTLGLTNGPRLAFARPEAAAEVKWLEFATQEADGVVRRFAAPTLVNTAEIEVDPARKLQWAGFKLEVSADGQNWRTLFDSSRRFRDGKRFNFPPQPIAAVRVTDVRTSDGQPAAITTLRLGYAAGRFPAGSAAAVPTLTTGLNDDTRTGPVGAWLESRGTAGLDRVRWTLRADGALQLDYNYNLDGEFIYHGVTFDHPEEQMQSLRWLGEGPYRVWQNRLRGTWLDVHEIVRTDFQPGEAWPFPEFQGCFAGVRWADLRTTNGVITLAPSSPDIYLRVGTPRINHPNTTPDFPAGDLSVLHAIPAIGSKFVTPADTGPLSRPAKAAGTYSGTVVLRFADPEAKN